MTKRRPSRRNLAAPGLPRSADREGRASRPVDRKTPHTKAGGWRADEGEGEGGGMGGFRRQGPISGLFGAVEDLQRAGDGGAAALGDDLDLVVSLVGEEAVQVDALGVGA